MLPGGGGGGKALHAGAMPPPGNPKPTEAEVALLAGWVNAGAIDWTVLPTRASTILDTNCSKCHNGSTGFDVKNLSSLTDKSLIVAGKVSESKLLAKIISGQMPPAGNPAVRARDLAVLKAWVEDGAGFVEIDCRIVNQDGKVTTPGTARARLPLRVEGSRA